MYELSDKSISQISWIADHYEWLSEIVFLTKYTIHAALINPLECLKLPAHMPTS